MKNYLRNKKGNILILSYLIVALLLVFGGTFISRAFSEMRTSKIFENSAQAFHAAEAMLSEAFWRLNASKPLPPDPVTIVTGTTTEIAAIKQTLIDTEVTAEGKVITVAATGSGPEGIYTKVLTQYIQDSKFAHAVNAGKDVRIIPLNEAATPPVPMPSWKGNVILGSTRISGKVKKTQAPLVTVDADELIEDANPVLTKIHFPDANQNGKTDPGEFVEYYDKVTDQLIADNPENPDIVQVINTGANPSSVNIDPSTLSDNTQMVYVTGGGPLVNLYGNLGEDQDLTVVTNGNIMNTVNGQVSEDPPLLATFSYSGTMQKPANLNDKFEQVMMSFGDVTVQSPSSMNANIITEGNVDLEILQD